MSKEEVMEEMASEVVVAAVVVASFPVKFCRVVEPTTKRSPAELMVEVAVPPKYAVVAEKLVEEAAPFRRTSEVVALVPAAGCVKGSAIDGEVFVMVHVFPLRVVDMPVPFVRVVEATHAGVPAFHASTCPFVPVPYRVEPKVEVARAVGAAALPVWFTKTVLAF